MNKATRLGALSIVETVSFALLLVAMLSHSETGVSVIGAIHGVLFLAYAALVWMDHQAFGWTRAFAALAIFTGPVGPVIVLERLRRSTRPIGA